MNQQELLIDTAEKAIMKVFGDTMVSPAETRAVLKSLIDKSSC